MNDRNLGEIKVLDHGFIRLLDVMGDDLAIVRAARCSYDADWRAGTDEGSDEKLLRSLARRGHVTPLEAVEFKFEIQAPIFVFRQWHRHRTWSYNEVSGRYVELEEVFFVPDPLTVGHQMLSEKQARAVNPDLPPERLAQRERECELIRAHNEAAFKLYYELLATGWPRELARTHLPLGTYSRMFAKVDLNNLFRFLRERLARGAQREIRAYAEAIVTLIQPEVPIALDAFLKSL